MRHSVVPPTAYPVCQNSGMVDTIMDTSNSITAAMFSAFLKCPTKAYLIAIGEPAPNPFFADIEARILSMYKSEVTRRLRAGAGVAEPLDCDAAKRKPVLKLENSSCRQARP